MSLKGGDSEETGPNAQLARLVEAGFATLTDEMIARVAKTASDSLTLLDELHRSHAIDALPVIGEMVASGDLARLAHIARLLGAAEDALTDDLIGRLSAFASGGMAILDRLNQADSDRFWRLWELLAGALTPALMDRVVKNLPALLDILEQAEESGLVQDVMSAALRAREDLAALPRPAGGFAGLWTLMKDADNQRTIQALLLYGRQFFGVDRKD